MSDIRYDYKYYNVGQGLFHSGKIKDFSFIYDCGSFNKEALEKCIMDYVSTDYDKHKGVDLLILSHFDADHINGLDILFSSGVNVDTVIIPYISLIDRIIIASKNKDEDDWYYEFMYDNVKYLKSKGVKNVIVIRHDQDGPLFLDNDIQSNNNDIQSNNNDSALNWDKMVESTLPTDTIIDDYLDDSDFKVFNDSGHVMLHNVWIFKFYAQEISEKIKSKEKKHKGSKPTKERFLQILREDKIINKSKPMNDQIREAIMNPTLRKKIVKAYRKLSKDLNYTSLMMYNGPLGRFENYPHIYGYEEKYQLEIIKKNCLEIRRNPVIRNDNVFGQLMTGDAFINTKKQYQKFENHFGWLLEKTIIVLMPHHGSNRNWNTSILTDCKNAWLWIASAGFSNKYSHPGYNAVMDIIRTDRIVARCDEFIKIYLSGEIKWL